MVVAAAAAVNKTVLGFVFWCSRRAQKEWRYIVKRCCTQKISITTAVCWIAWLISLTRVLGWFGWIACCQNSLPLCAWMCVRAAKAPPVHSSSTSTSTSTSARTSTSASIQQLNEFGWVLSMYLLNSQIFGWFIWHCVSLSSYTWWHMRDAQGKTVCAFMVLGIHGTQFVCFSCLLYLGNCTHTSTHWLGSHTFKYIYGVQMLYIFRATQSL